MVETKTPCSIRHLRFATGNTPTSARVRAWALSEPLILVQIGGIYSNSGGKIPSNLLRELLSDILITLLLLVRSIKSRSMFIWYLLCIL